MTLNWNVASLQRSFVAFGFSTNTETCKQAILEKEADGVNCKLGSNSNTSLWLKTNSLNKIAFEAAKEQQEERELTDFQFQQAGCNVRTFALVDLKNNRVYALKFELNTTTSSATDYFLLTPFSRMKWVNLKQNKHGMVTPVQSLTHSSLVCSWFSLQFFLRHTCKSLLPFTSLCNDDVRISEERPWRCRSTWTKRHSTSDSHLFQNHIFNW